jgi:hypothetical protein
MSGQVNLVTQRNGQYMSRLRKRKGLLPFGKPGCSILTAGQAAYPYYQYAPRLGTMQMNSNGSE